MLKKRREMKLDVRINRICETSHGAEFAKVEILNDTGQVILSGDLFTTEHFNTHFKDKKRKENMT